MRTMLGDLKSHIKIHLLLLICLLLYPENSYPNSSFTYYAYVTNYDSNTVSVIDTSSNTR